jgi:DNA-binding PadR family transcriptional regulator
MARRRSRAESEILVLFTNAGCTERYGLEIAKELRIRSGTLYPALARLERDGLLKSHWEDADPSSEGRPRRRMYQLTAQGVPAAAAERQHLYERLHIGAPTPLVIV